jgi:membrane protein
MSLGRLRALLLETVDRWRRDNVPVLAAALSYYAVFSLAPLLVVVIAVAGVVFGVQAARGDIIGQIRDLIGNDGAQGVQSLLENAPRPATGLVATLAGLVALFLGASGVFVQLQQGLNLVAGLPVRSGLGVLLRQRLASFALVVGVGFLLLISLLLSAAFTALTRLWGGIFAGTGLAAEAINFVLSFVLVTALFAMIYRYLPDAQARWRDVAPGAVAASLLFTVGKSLIGFYLGRSHVASAYGAAGSLVVLLIWIYYSAQILFFGAELNRACRSSLGMPRSAGAGRTLEISGERDGTRLREQSGDGPAGGSPGAARLSPGDPGAERGSAGPRGGREEATAGADAGRSPASARRGAGGRASRDAAPRPGRG